MKGKGIDWNRRLLILKIRFKRMSLQLVQNSKAINNTITRLQQAMKKEQKT